jgi:hypothetical protein
MPAKVRPEDWDAHFSVSATRRGGPLRALANVLLFGLGIALLGVGGFFGLRFRDQIQQAGVATATAQARAAATQAVLAQQTAEAREQALVPTATTVATIAPEPTLGDGEVRQGGNLRSEPRVVPETVIGLIYPGDKVVFLEEQTVDGTAWFRVRVTEPALSRAGQGVAPGTEGWASSLLLSPLP